MRHWRAATEAIAPRHRAATSIIQADESLVDELQNLIVIQ
jgi:hypothetical protein